MIADLQKQLGIDSSFFYQFVIFIFIFLWLRFVYFSPFLKLILQRESQSDGLTEEAQKLNEEANRLEGLYQEALGAARRRASGERDILLAAARKKSTDLTAEARSQAKIKMETAREQAARSAENDLNGLKSQVGPISSLLVEKLMKTKVGL